MRRKDSFDLIYMLNIPLTFFTNVKIIPNEISELQFLSETKLKKINLNNNFKSFEAMKTSLRHIKEKEYNNVFQ